MSVPQALVGGRYRLIEVIAHGGMGVVWRGQDERLDRPVAVKALRTHPGITEREAEVAKNRALREAHITAQLEHPHAVPVLDAVEHEGQPCLPYLPSTPLSAVLRKRTRLPLRDVIRIGAQTASALAAAHRLRIVHRDVKPGNVLITKDGTAHLSDFGISHAMGDATLTDTGFLHGTPAYLSPEVARGGSATFASDVFCLGSTLYAAIEGAPPFGSDPNPIALLHKVAAARVETPEHAGALTPLLLQMLSEDKASRPTMEVVAASLAHLRAQTAPADQARPAATSRAPSRGASAAALASWFPPTQDAPTASAQGGAVSASAVDPDSADSVARASVTPPQPPAPEPPGPEPDAQLPARAAHDSSTRDRPPSKTAGIASSAAAGASSAGADPDDQATARRRVLVGLGSIAALVAAVLVLATLTGESGQDAPETAGGGVALATTSATPGAAKASPAPAAVAAPPLEATSPAGATEDATTPAPTRTSDLQPEQAAPTESATEPTTQDDPEPAPEPEPAAEPSTQAPTQPAAEAETSPA